MIDVNFSPPRVPRPESGGRLLMLPEGMEPIGTHLAVLRGVGCIKPSVRLNDDLVYNNQRNKIPMISRIPIIK